MQFSPSASVIDCMPSLVRSQMFPIVKVSHGNEIIEPCYDLYKI